MSERIKRLKRNAGYGLNYKTENLKTIMTEKWQLVLLISLFWAGLFIGTIYINNAEGEIAEQIRSIIYESYNGRSEYGHFYIFKNAIIKYSVFLFLSFFFGLCGLGYPLVASVPVLCGIANGLMSGYLYTNLGISGLFYCLLTIYPPLVLSLVALVIGCCESLDMSKTIIKLLCDKHQMTVENTLKKYIYQYFILTIIVFASSIGEVILCHFFLEKFTF